MDYEPFESYWAETLSARNRKRSNTGVKIVQDYVSRTGGTCTSEVLAQVDHELGRYQDMAILNPRESVEPMLKTLKGQGLRLGLLTNSDGREVREWPNSSLAGSFDTVCFSCDIGFEKPDPAAYQVVLDRLGVPASEAAYVGDGGNRELEGARAAGFGLIVFMEMFVAKNGLRTLNELEAFRRTADRTVNSLEELPRLVGVDYARR